MNVETSLEKFVNIEIPLDCRVVVSEFEKTHKTFIKVTPDQILRSRRCYRSWMSDLPKSLLLKIREEEEYLKVQWKI